MLYIFSFLVMIKTVVNSFSDDNKWYRAVILEVGENEISVVYADFGNTETVPFSRILPIPPHLLQLPFVIIRCSLAGKKKKVSFTHFLNYYPEQSQTFLSSFTLL